jgi:site-specific DNA-methyltransferase (adenine-specific)
MRSMRNCPILRSYKDNKERNDYLDWLQDVAEASFPILKDNGSFFLNIAGRPTDPMLPFLVVDRFKANGKLYNLQNTVFLLLVLL